jgi:transcriptional regulator with XRE-family HTH domain
MSIGEKIRELREEKKLTQEYLASQVGYAGTNAKSSINKIELGKANPPFNKLQKFADALGVTVQYLTSAAQSVVEETEEKPMVNESAELYCPKHELPKSKSALITENAILLRENDRLKTILLNKVADIKTLLSE